MGSMAAMQGTQAPLLRVGIDLALSKENFWTVCEYPNLTPFSHSSLPLGRAGRAANHRQRRKSI